MDDIKIKLVERFERVLKEHNTSPVEIAKKLGVPNANIYSILNPEKNHMPNLRLYMSIVEMFPRINTRWLMFGTGTMYRVDKIKSLPAIKNSASLAMHLTTIEDMIREEEKDDYLIIKHAIMDGYRDLNDKVTSLYEPLFEISTELKNIQKEEDSKTTFIEFKFEMENNFKSLTNLIEEKIIKQG